MSFITKQIEKKLGVDLNGDGVIGSGRHHYPPGQRGGGLVNKLEKATHIDFNGDGRIGGPPTHFSGYPPYGGSTYPTPYNPYGSPPPPPNSHRSDGGAGMVNELEKATNIDLNGDGRIGGPSAYPSNYSPNYPSYGGPPPPPNFHRSDGGAGMVNELEKATNIDLNGDGRIGGPSAYPSNYPPYGGPSANPSNYSPYGGPPPSSNCNQSGGASSMINELEKATNIDLNGDGRIGGQNTYLPNHQPYGGLSCASAYGTYNSPPPSSNFHQSDRGAGMINELEKATNIDLNGDGRIGGPSAYPSNYSPNYPSYGGPPPPPNFHRSDGGAGMINELEKATNIDLNGDGRIGGGPVYPGNYNSYGYRH